jgi:glutamyl-tRNA synthetase
MDNREVRVRFAPSPTGALHIGGVRTALYNYLLAKKTGGKFILRIEDTDQNRFVPGAEEYIVEALNWCGIQPDEGIVQGGPYAPYRQSERKLIYKEFAQKLVDEGNAYYAFDTPEELEEMREKLTAAKVAMPQYNSITRHQMKNSLTLSEAEVKERIDSGSPYVIRLKVPKKEEIRLNDLIRGWVMVHSTTIDDKVLMKSDGMPTYHLANVVDDHLMKITHVVRGEEWLPSAPLHVLLYRFLGWEDTMPQFAHLPLLLKPDGNGKLSKRDAEAHGFPIFPLQWKDPISGELVAGFREEGYLPEAMVNFLAFLGWNPGTEQEIFSFIELVETFSIERVGKSGTKFDITKAKWYNQYYLRQKTNYELSVYLLDELKKKNISIDQAKAERVCGIMKERVTFPRELYLDSLFFFEAPEKYDPKVAESKWTQEAAEVIKDFGEKLEWLDDFKAEKIHDVLQSILDNRGLKIGKVLQSVRLAITGLGSGPDLMQIIEEIGKDQAILRIKNALDRIPITKR